MDDSENEQEKPPPAAHEGYEPPRVEWLGNLRDLVGKSGTGSDVPKPNPRRP